MLISVKHKTTYIYEEDVEYSIQSIRLTPKNYSGQKIVSWNMTAPNLDNALVFTDSFGNDVHTITIQGLHNKIEICAESIVETKDCNGVLSDLPELIPVGAFLRDTPQTEPNEEIDKLAQQAKKEKTLDTLHSLNAIILDKVKYQRGSTNANTTASEALEKAKGVCQDHTHIFISAARTLKIPARYITGYLVTKEKGEAHHAWAEVYVDNLGWVGFDVTNQLCPTDRYIRMTCGLDAMDAAPIRGTFQGGDNEKLNVIVDVQQQ